MASPVFMIVDVTKSHPTINSNDVTTDKNIITTSCIILISPSGMSIIPFSDIIGDTSISSENTKSLLETSLMSMSSNSSPSINLSSPIPNSHKAFLIGRKVQFINDYYPVFNMEPPIKMHKLLPHLVTSKHLIEENMELCKERCIFDSSLYTHDLCKLDIDQQYKLGRDYQFLLDTDIDETKCSELTPFEIPRRAYLEGLHLYSQYWIKIDIRSETK